MRITKLIIMLVVLLSINAVGQDLNSTHAYVFSADKKVALMKVAPGAKRYTPSISDMQKADSLLLKYLKFSNGQIEISETYYSYFRQYVGVQKPGLKGIYINAYCRKPAYFTSDTFYPRGGGICYFRCLVNLEKSKVEDFYYNAPK